MGHRGEVRARAGRDRAEEARNDGRVVVIGSLHWQEQGQERTTRRPPGSRGEERRRRGAAEGAGGRGGRHGG
jgi:hypothetical protein